MAGNERDTGMNLVATDAGVAGTSWRWGAETPDDAVLERVCAGETALYEVLMHRHNPRLRSVVRRILPNEADVEEVVQDTHYNAFRFLSQFSGRSSFATWLSRIAFHAALTRLRRRAHSHAANHISATDEEPLETAVSGERDPEQQLQDKETRVALDVAVRALPRTYRAVLLLRQLEELSTNEVAARLGISAGCVKTRLRRAQALLRKRLH